MRPLLLAVAAVAFVAAGCGAAQNEPNLAAAIEKTEAAGSSLIAIDGTDVESGKRVEIRCRGKADYERKRLQFSCGGEGRDFEMLALAGTTYLRGELLGIRDGSKWLKLTDDSDNYATEFSPPRLLVMLRGASQETTRIGQEDVRGVPTVRYRLEVDCVRAKLFDCEGTTTPVEVWIDDEDLVRRIWVEERSSSGTIDFYDFGVDVVVEPPPADQVVDLRETLGLTRCEPGFGTPVTIARALAAIRASGFSVPTATDCTGPLAAFGNTDAGPRVREREGQLHCFLQESSPSGESTSVRRKDADGADVRLSLHNLECALLADSPQNEEKIDRLEAAFAELERTVRP